MLPGSRIGESALLLPGALHALNSGNPMWQRRLRASVKVPFGDQFGYEQGPGSIQFRAQACRSFRGAWSVPARHPFVVMHDLVADGGGVPVAGVDDGLTGQ